ncbi:MAG: hypothetical protein ABSG23_06400 [Terriglobales bacterium]|jgi:hypothetical protein
MRTTKVALVAAPLGKTEYKSRMESVARTLILGEHKTDINSQDLHLHWDDCIVS